MMSLTPVPTLTHSTKALTVMPPNLQAFLELKGFLFPSNPLIGEGAYSTVYKAYKTYKYNATFYHQIPVAIKVSKKYFCSLHEARILKYIHQNCYPLNTAQLIEDFTHAQGLDKRFHIIVLELLKCSLFQQMTLPNKALTTRRFSLKEIRKITRGLLPTLHSLETNGIIHGDLKPENIMFGDKGDPRIIDFSNSITQKKSSNCRGFYAQSRFYRAAEIAGECNLPKTTKMDMWSLGCILFELYAGHPLFPSKSKNGHLPMILKRLGLPQKIFIKSIKPIILKKLFDKNLKDLNEPTKKLLTTIKTDKIAESIFKAKKAVASSREEKLFHDLLRKIIVYAPSKRPKVLEVAFHSFMIYNPLHRYKEKKEGKSKLPARKKTPPKKKSQIVKPKKIQTKIPISSPNTYEKPFSAFTTSAYENKND